MFYRCATVFVHDVEAYAFHDSDELHHDNIEDDIHGPEAKYNGHIDVIMDVV